MYLGNVDEIVGEMAKQLNAPSFIVEAATQTYYVQPGDIMGIKARQWGIPLSKIQELNPGVDLGRIKPEQEILLPPNALMGVRPPKEVSIFIANPSQTLAVNSKIRELASKHGLPPALIYAHIYRESGYYAGADAVRRPYFDKKPTTREEVLQPTGQGFLVNPARTSSAGATGLYQVMPQNTPKGIDPWDPVQSLELGVDWFVNKSGVPEARGLLAKYLQKKAPKEEELLEMALYVYNAGQGSVERALRAKGPDFRSALPTETQAYAPTILKWMKQNINYLILVRPAKIMVK